MQMLAYLKMQMPFVLLEEHRSPRHSAPHTAAGDAAPAPAQMSRGVTDKHLNKLCSSMSGREVAEALAVAAHFFIC